MKVEVKEIKELVRELSIMVPADVVHCELEQAFADLRQQVSIKGYRKGKAPMNLVKSKYADSVKADVADQLIRSSYRRAIEEKQLKVVSRPTLTDLGYKEDGAFHYIAQVEVLPLIDSVNFDNLQNTSVDTAITDQDVDAVTLTFRKMFADFRPVDREARSDDVVVVDLKKVYDPDLALKTDLMKDVEIDLARSFTVKEFQEQLPGMRVGEEKEIMVVYDKDYPDSAFAGARITFACKIKSIKERILPEFDDALAKRTGKAETALELRMKFREDLERHQTSELRKIHRSQIVRQICEQNKIPVPESMVKEYLDAIVENEKKNNATVDEEAVRSNAREFAIHAIRWDMLYHHIAEQEKIEVSSTDTEQIIQGLAREHKLTFEQARQALERSGKIASIRDRMLEEKVLDFLTGKAKVIPASSDVNK